MNNYALGSFHDLPGCMRLKVAGDVVAKMGDIACFDGLGYITVGSATTGLVIAGTFAEDVDTTGKASGDPFGPDAQLGPFINTKFAPMPRLFWFANASGGDAVTQAQVGLRNAIYINGARQVTKTSTGRSVAGTAIDLSEDGTKVRIEIAGLTA